MDDLDRPHHEHHEHQHQQHHHHEYHEHCHDGGGHHRQHKDRACSPRRKRKIFGKILFAILSVLALLIVAACVWISVYGLH